MFLISTKGKNTSDIWICIYIYESALIAIYVKKSPLLDFNIICKPCCPSSFKLGRAGSVSWHQHLCSTSGQFSDNCYQVSARINSFWISLIRSVAAISPETYLGALEMIPTATTTSTATTTASERLKLIIDSPQVVLILPGSQLNEGKQLPRLPCKASWKSVSSSWKWTPDPGANALTLDEKLDAFNDFHHKTLF